VAGALAGLLATIGIVAPVSADESVTILSDQLHGCLNRALGVDTWMAPITADQLATLTHVDCSAWAGIDDLTGLEHATELEYLDVSGNSVDDLAPLAGLDHLSYLDISDQEIEALGGLADLTTLTTLKMRAVKVYLDTIDLGLLNGMANLETLDVSDNNLVDISSLAALPSLVSLTANKNKLVSLAAFAERPDITVTAYSQKFALTPGEPCAFVPLPAILGSDGLPVAIAEGNRTLALADGGAYPVSAYGTLLFGSELANFDGMLTLTLAANNECSWVRGGAASISGTGTTADPFTAVVEPWVPTPDDVTYYWKLVGGAVIGSGPTLVVPSQYLGQQIYFTATAYRTMMSLATSTSAPVLAPPITDPAWKATFLNQLIAGFTADVDKLWDLHGAATVCDWYIDGVKKATNSTCRYLVPTSAAGKHLRVRVTATPAGGSPTVYVSESTLILKYYAPLGLVLGTISGPHDVGKVLTVTPTTYHPAPTSYTYQWLRDDTEISGATGKTYTVRTGDAGHKIAVAMTAHRSGYAAATDVSMPVAIHRLFTAKPAPTISGTTAVGFTLMAERGTWSPTPSGLTYQWYRDGKAISGATKSTYKAATADGGHSITVKVTATRSGYTTSYRTSAAAAVLKRLTSAPTPTINGTAKVKNTLTAHVGTWGPGTVTKSYQWYRNGTPIPGATKSTYAVALTDAYASITFRVTAKKSGYLTVTRTSKATVPTGIKYSNCAALATDYPGGVASNSTVPGIGPDTYVSAKLYALNSSRDGDNDGWACEPN
jgi:hypothetical protein